MPFIRLSLLEETTSGGYYGRLWEIKTVNSGNTVLQDIQYSWDAKSNLTQRYDVAGKAKENYGYSKGFLFIIFPLDSWSDYDINGDKFLEVAKSV